MALPVSSSFRYICAVSSQSESVNKIVGSSVGNEHTYVREPNRDSLIDKVDCAIAVTKTACSICNSRDESP